MLQNKSNNKILQNKSNNKILQNNSNNEILTIVSNLLDSGHGIQAIQKALGFPHLTCQFFINEVKLSRRNNMAKEKITTLSCNY